MHTMPKSPRHSIHTQIIRQTIRFIIRITQPINDAIDDFMRAIMPATKNTCITLDKGISFELPIHGWKI